MEKITTKSPEETKRIAADLARRVFAVKRKEAIIIALEGDLGSGKTTFVQGFARALGIRENVLSPTFVLMKIYKILPRYVRKVHIRHLIHVDCYRLDSPKDLLHLGFRDILKDKDAVILIEWADRIKRLLSCSACRITFRHGNKIHERMLEISNFSYLISNESSHAN